MKEPPAFQCYASNIIADKNFRLMSILERGLWMTMYLECWPNKSIPANPEDLAKYLGFSEIDVQAGLTERVLSFFGKKNNDLICPEHEEYRTKLHKRSEQKSEGGKLGSKRKQERNSVNLQGTPQGTPTGTPTGTPQGSLIQSNLNQSNQMQSIGKSSSESIKEWAVDYEKEEMKSDYLKASGRGN